MRTSSLLLLIAATCQCFTVFGCPVFCTCQLDLEVFKIECADHVDSIADFLLNDTDIPNTDNLLVLMNFEIDNNKGATISENDSKSIARYLSTYNKAVELRIRLSARKQFLTVEPTAFSELFKFPVTLLELTTEPNNNYTLSFQNCGSLSGFQRLTALKLTNLALTQKNCPIFDDLLRLEQLDLSDCDNNVLYRVKTAALPALLELTFHPILPDSVEDRQLVDFSWLHVFPKLQSLKLQSNIFINCTLPVNFFDFFPALVVADFAYSGLTTFAVDICSSLKHKTSSGTLKLQLFLNDMTDLDDLSHNFQKCKFEKPQQIKVEFKYNCACLKYGSIHKINAIKNGQMVLEAATRKACSETKLFCPRPPIAGQPIVCNSAQPSSSSDAKLSSTTDPSPTLIVDSPISYAASSVIAVLAVLLGVFVVTSVGVCIRYRRNRQGRYDDTSDTRPLVQPDATETGSQSEMYITETPCSLKSLQPSGSYLSIDEERMAALEEGSGRWQELVDGEQNTEDLQGYDEEEPHIGYEDSVAGSSLSSGDQLSSSSTSVTCQLEPRHQRDSESTEQYLHGTDYRSDTNASVSYLSTEQYLHGTDYRSDTNASVSYLFGLALGSDSQSTDPYLLGSDGSHEVLLDQCHPFGSADNAKGERDGKAGHDYDLSIDSEAASL